MDSQARDAQAHSNGQQARGSRSIDRSTQLPVPVRELIGDDAAAACKRITGWTLSDWEAEWRRRRRIAFNEGYLQTARLYDTAEMHGLCVRYGFEAEDFVAVMAEVEEIMARDPTYTPPVQGRQMATRALRWMLCVNRFNF